MGKGSQENACSDVDGAGGPTVPEQVSIALGEIAGDVREGLLALAVGAGLQVMTAMMAADVAAAAGPKGHHDPNRTAVRHGHEDGSVTLGGRRVPVRRPRMRAVDGSGELPVPSYECFTGTEMLGGMAMERMLGAGHAALRRRARAGRRAGRSRQLVDVEVRGVAAVRQGHRDRASRAAGR